MMLSDRYREALNLTFELHRTQERKGSGVPYVAHLLGVSSLALEFGADEDGAIAALLHDAVEDQGGAPVLARIERQFGSKVASIVEACTDNLEEPKLAWRPRKERYVAHLAAAPPAVQLVSACDKLYNLRAILADYRAFGETVWQRFSGGREGLLWYYGALAQAFGSETPIAQEFQRTWSELQRLLANGKI